MDPFRFKPYRFDTLQEVFTLILRQDMLYRCRMKFSPISYCARSCHWSSSKSSSSRPSPPFYRNTNILPGVLLTGSFWIHIVLSMALFTRTTPKWTHIYIDLIEYTLSFAHFDLLYLTFTTALLLMELFTIQSVWNVLHYCDSKLEYLCHSTLPPPSSPLPPLLSPLRPTTSPLLNHQISSRSQSKQQQQQQPPPPPPPPPSHSFNIIKTITRGDQTKLCHKYNRQTFIFGVIYKFNVANFFVIYLLYFIYVVIIYIFINNNSNSSKNSSIDGRNGDGGATVFTILSNYITNSIVLLHRHQSTERLSLTLKQLLFCLGQLLFTVCYASYAITNPLIIFYHHYFFIQLLRIRMEKCVRILLPPPSSSLPSLMSPVQNNNQNNHHHHYRLFNKWFRYFPTQYLSLYNDIVLYNRSIREFILLIQSVNTICATMLFLIYVKQQQVSLVNLPIVYLLGSTFLAIVCFSYYVQTILASFVSTNQWFYQRYTVLVAKWWYKRCATLMTFNSAATGAVKTKTFIIKEQRSSTSSTMIALKSKISNHISSQYRSVRVQIKMDTIVHMLAEIRFGFTIGPLYLVTKYKCAEMCCINVAMLLLLYKKFLIHIG